MLIAKLWHPADRRGSISYALPWARCTEDCVDLGRTLGFPIRAVVYDGLTRKVAWANTFTDPADLMRGLLSIERICRSVTP